jgi:hypothetical protein
MKAAYSKLKKSPLIKKKKVTTKKLKSKTTKALKVIALCLFSLAVLGSFTLYKYFNENYAWAFDESSFNNQSGVVPSFLLITKDSPVSISRIYFVIADKNANKLLIHNIDPQIKIDMPGRFGEETLSNIIRISELENKEYTEMLSLAVLKLFKFNVTNYLVVDSPYQNNVDRLLIEGMPSAFYNPVELTGIKTNIKTDFKLKELYDLSKFANSLPEDRKLIENITPTTKVEEDYSELNFDSALNNEKLSIAVVNSTGKEGFATLIADIVQNLGGRIVGITNTDKPYEASFIITDTASSESVKLISDIFKIKGIKAKSEVSNLNISEIDRSEVIIVLGFDTVSWLY